MNKPDYCDQGRAHMSVSAGQEKGANFVSKSFFLQLHCDQTIWIFQDFLTVLKSLCPVESKNSLVLVLANFFLKQISSFSPYNRRLLAIFEDEDLRITISFICSALALVLYTNLPFCKLEGANTEAQSPLSDWFHFPIFGSSFIYFPLVALFNKNKMITDI